MQLNRRRFLLAMMSAGCIACAPTSPMVPLDPPGDLSLLTEPFPLDALPTGWGLTGDRAAFHWMSDVEGRVWIRAVPTGRGAVLYRRSDLLLAAHPYLSWQWTAERRQHIGVRLLVGFRRVSGRPARDELYDYALSLAFGGMAPRAQPHGGSETVMRADMPLQVGVWRRDGVDLAALHRHWWPDVPVTEAHVSLLGVQVGEPSAGSAVRLTGILLSR